MNRVIEKVTVFVVRALEGERHLLLLEHPYAGIQIPAGTVEKGESPDGAALREAAEETGLTDLSIRRALGFVDDDLPAGQWAVTEPCRVYSRPDPTSFDWALLRGGIRVTETRRERGFVQVTYEEPDRYPDPRYVTMQITGWVREKRLASRLRRFFFELEFGGRSPEQWAVDTDNHRFVLFWAPLSNLPRIADPQQQWLSFLPS